MTLFFVLMKEYYLNYLINSPKYTDKFKIYSANLPNENTTDPFRMKEEEYFLVMKSIEDIANNLYLDIEKM